MSVRDQFTRTVCACQGCRRLCKTIPGMLAPGDPDLIAEHLGITSEEMNGKLLASPGAIVRDRITQLLRRIPTIVPDRKPDGSCVFLNEKEECTIHPVAPYGCAYFDDHMSAPIADRRSAAVLIAISQDPLYQARWKKLWDKGQRAPAPETLRAKLGNQ